MKGRGKRKLNWSRAEKDINFIYIDACTEMISFSIKISCICFRILHSHSWLLGRHPHAIPETAARSVACAAMYSEAVKMGDTGFFTGIRNACK